MISNPDAISIYQVPEILRSEGIVETICERLNLTYRNPKFETWQRIADQFVTTKDSVKIAMVGKYISLADGYASVNEALMHAGAQQGFRPVIENVDSQDFESNPESIKRLEDYHGILIPQGFGKRGSEGKILAANFARENAIPYIGLCFGFQLAIVSFARHVLGLIDANSTELNSQHESSRH